MKQTDFVGGFAKGLQVIEAFDAASPQMTITRLSEATGLDRATTRRCLLTLVELGYARHDGKHFELTPKILRLGHAYLAATPLPRLIQPHLDALSEEVRQSASASVLEGTEILYIARAAQKRVMSINLTPGSRLPAWCASMGRVLLASLPEAEAHALLQRSQLQPFTPFTLTTEEAVMAECRRVREQGYAVVDQELELGLCSIAVPLADISGRVVAALNIGASAAQVAAAEMPGLYLPTMRRIQAALRPLLRPADPRAGIQGV
ncbi:IclR family transcriptional regulator domain-containing protein [Ancylobacter oerskovii]|uniref:IclR family transcriptional regulator C-terminal domain-containing protein n=1 Tax=Ancylobacter oerskovii TaxID=459519 RepID=A0ABW4YWM1_9HYPH|nr:IclR family transcriptional regulator C-terminal domain-containing protein [Ancylobacter oerskovii]MBS7544138.1 helix-turn-helix domain-containing protein [Ancylobacter oerskovii]